MAFLNDARQLAEQATRQLEQVRERIDELQQQRHFNQLARDLGLLVYRSRRGGRPLDELEVERISAEMASIEAALASPGRPGPAGPGAGAQGPGAGAQGPGAGGPGSGETAQGPGESTQGPGQEGDPPAQSGGYSLDDV